MDIAIREATRLDKIITEFLQYARPPALNLGEHDLNKVLAETLDLVQHEARTRNEIKIVTTGRLKRCLAQVDQDQLKQVFWNLATNAFEAMPDGGHLTITTGLQTESMWRAPRRCHRNGISGQRRRNPQAKFRQNFPSVFHHEKRRVRVGAGRRCIALWICTGDGSRWTVSVGTGARFVVCLPRSAEAGVRLWHEGREPWKRF